MHQVVSTNTKLSIDGSNIIKKNYQKLNNLNIFKNEVLDSLTATVEQKMGDLDPFTTSIADVLTLSGHNIKLDDSEHFRENIEIIFKLFLVDFEDAEQLVSQLKRVIQSVGYVDVLIVSYGDSACFGISDLFVKFWRLLEENVGPSGLIRSMGVADTGFGRLKELYEMAETKPVIYQSNFEDCCVIPVDLSSFCAQNDVKIIAHNDPKLILVIDELNESLNRLFGSDWRIRMLIRRSAVVPLRGLISHKGYSVYASR